MMTNEIIYNPFPFKFYSMDQNKDRTYIPYGDADFQSIRRNNQFYIDKTEFIPNLEKEGRNLFFVRPPRYVLHFYFFS